jgi:two-component system response regulator HydG
MSDPIILLISRDPSVAETVRRTANDIGQLDLACVADLDQAFNYTAWDRVCLVLLHYDRRTTTIGVLRLLRMLSAARRSVATILLSEGHEDTDAAELLRMGAADLLTRPFDIARLSYLVEVLTVRSRRLTTMPVVSQSVVEMRSKSDSDSLSTEAQRLATSDATILIQGESGVGKTRLARLIHDQSPRSGRPFVTVRCSSLANNGLANELFGRDCDPGPDGLGTGRMADAREGTLVLDDADMLSLQSQAALIGWIEDMSRLAAFQGRPKSQPRLIATTRALLADEVTAGRFRSDLFYRLNVVGVTVPPLRERKEEISELAKSLVQELAGASVSLSPEALQAIESHSWMGNVRELREVIESAIAQRRGSVIGRELLPEAVRASSLMIKPSGSLNGVGDEVRPPVAQVTLAQTKREAEFARITQALEKHGHNRLRTASELGISRMTLYKKLYKYGIIEQEEREGNLPGGRSRRLVTPASQTVPMDDADHDDDDDF